MRTFRTLKWKNSIEENTKFFDGTKLPMLLVGNKLDLVDEGSELINEFDMFAKENDFIGSFKTSAKKDINVADSMEFLVKHVIAKIEALSADKMEVKKESIILQKPNNLAKRGDSACC